MRKHFNALFRPKRYLYLLAAFFLTLPWVALATDFKLGLVLDKGGKDDKSFNAAAYRGAMEAKKNLNIFVKYVEASDDGAIELMLRSFAQKDFDLIIGIGVSQADAIKKVAAEFPNKHFAVVDAQVKAPNVRSLLFEEHEGSYLIGAIAAMTTKTGKIGFIGGMDIPLIRRFEMGYIAGAKKIRPEIILFSNYVGMTGEAWNNPPRAKELAVIQYDKGADVVFAAAGASNSGLFDAAEEKKKLAIGVDSNQDWIKPGFILTSMLKSVDKAVYSACEDAVKGKFSSGVESFGLKNKGVDYTVDEYNQKVLTPEVRTKADKIKSEIIEGKIQVPDFYKRR